MMAFPWLNHYDPGVPHHLEYPAITAHEMLEQAAESFPDKACTIYKDLSLTYAQVDALSDQLAAGLAASGVKKGDRVGLLMPNIPHFVFSYFGALKAGAVVVAINPLYSPREIRNQLVDSGVEVMVGLNSLLPAIKQASAGTQLRLFIVVDPDEKLSHPKPLFQAQGKLISRAERGAGIDFNIIRLRDLLSTYAPEDHLRVQISPEDEALFQYSGGTTGISKSAIAVHRNLVANTLQFRHWLVGAQEGKETMLLAIPLYHVYGMVVGMLVSVRLGATMVLISNPRDLDNLLASLQRYRASLFPGVPNLYQAIVNHPDVQSGKYDLHTIKACISGSAPLLRETKVKFETLTGGKLLEGYGLSEAPTATHCNPMYGENRTGSIGLPLPDVDCRIVSLVDEVTPLPPGEAGELILRGPQVMKGYHNMPDETALTLREGWLYTGDIARMDAEGYFFLVDRKKDVIKPGGFQVWPREVEEVLERNPKVLEAGVAGIMDLNRGEVIKAWIVLRADFRPGGSESPEQAAEVYQTLEEELRRFCRQELAPFKVPTLFEFRAELPKTNVGKILRRELVRQHYENLS